MDAVERHRLAADARGHRARERHALHAARTASGTTRADPPLHRGHRLVLDARALEDLGVDWYRPYDDAAGRSRGFPWTRWFVGGRINIVTNASTARRGAEAGARLGGRRRPVARVDLRRAARRGEPRRRARCARSGVRPGDAVGIYMPMVPEVVVAFFALPPGRRASPCPSSPRSAREALAVRLQDAEAKVALHRRRRSAAAGKVVADQARRRTPPSPSARRVRARDRAAPHRACDVADGPARPLVARVGRRARRPGPPTEVARRRGAVDGPLHVGHDRAARRAPSTRTRAPGADRRRSSATRSTCSAGDLFFWLTDIGWMMGPWEMIGVDVLGAHARHLRGRAELARTRPALRRSSERHRVTHLGVSPTAIRLLRPRGTTGLAASTTSRSLRILGSTGEPWDPESRRTWYFEHVGGRRCPVINISRRHRDRGLPALAAAGHAAEGRARSAGPGLGMDVDVFDDDGQARSAAASATSCCKQPAPRMTKGFLNDDAALPRDLLRAFPGVWYHGDWAYVDEDGFWFLHGRSDDTIKVAGKRVGPGRGGGGARRAPGGERGRRRSASRTTSRARRSSCFVVAEARRTHDEAAPRGARASRSSKHLGKTLKPKALRFVRRAPEDALGQDRPRRDPPRAGSASPPATWRPSRTPTRSRRSPARPEPPAGTSPILHGPGHRL